MKHARKIAVGILCGRGETPEALQVIRRVNDDPHVSTVLPLFPCAPQLCKGKHIFYPPAADNRRGAARSQIVKILAALTADIYVVLDDDTLPAPDYFAKLATFRYTDEALLFTGQLLNADGTRCWDVCSFENGRPVIVPYPFIDHPNWYDDLYFSGPQHIFNKAGIVLAAQVGYPDLDYGEDTQFCRNFRAAGGCLEFLSGLSATLLHQHDAPNEPLLLK